MAVILVIHLFLANVSLYHLFDVDIGCVSGYELLYCRMSRTCDGMSGI